MSKTWHPETIAIRGGRQISDFSEHTQAMYMTSSFTYPTAEDASRLFVGEQAGYTYSRTSNPTIAAFEERMAQLEGAERGLATSSGMAAIHATLISLLQQGDHLLSSHSLFGSTSSVVNNMLPRYGIEVTCVSPVDLAAWEAAIQPNTKVLFLETPSNPLGEVADIKALAVLAHQHGAVLIVDNCFCTPAVQQPIKLGADISLASATKGIDGHGRAIGGIVCGSNALIEQVWNHVKTAGEIISPFNAWLLSSGLETLFVRLERECANAMALAQWLEQHPKVEKVYYGGLESHPQHELAKQQQRMFGVVVAFEVKGARKEAWHVVDSVQLFSRTGNLGDVKSTITHPYTTTHCRVSEEGKAAAGITEGLLRLSIGLENVADLQADLEQALAGI